MHLRTMFATLACCLALDARAAAFATDATDLWVTPQEMGWGVNVVQQNDILFLTLFVYGADANPTWFHAPSVQYQHTVFGAAYYQGDLFETRGQFFGGNFESENVKIRKVGTVSFVLEGTNQATMVYSVDQFTLTKRLVRVTFRRNFFPGFYLGATAGTYSGCSPASRNGYVEQAATAQLVEQDARTVRFKVDSAGSSCDYQGLYGQSGRLGYVSGFFNCGDGRAGTFDATDIQSTPEGFTARMLSRSSGCDWSGRFGGVLSDRTR